MKYLTWALPPDIKSRKEKESKESKLSIFRHLIIHDHIYVCVCACEFMCMYVYVCKNKNYPSHCAGKFIFNCKCL